MEDPLVFDIKRYAINDGPGIRITVFLKGCRLSCAWCHNPESISRKVEKLYTASKCIGCRACVEACPENAVELTPNGIVTNPGKCLLHGACAVACPAKATEICGENIPIEDLMKEIEKERLFFDTSGGGVTFSGGEPLIYHEFLIKILDRCGERHIHRVVDTCGYAEEKILLDVARRTDLFLYDLKHMDREQHKRWIGASNETILGNLEALAATGANIVIRIPLIENVNTDDENIIKSAEFVSKLSGDKKAVNLLPYHKVAETKFGKLGRPDDFRLLEEPSAGRIEHIIGIFEQHGLQASAGG